MYQHLFNIGVSLFAILLIITTQTITYIQPTLPVAQARTLTLEEQATQIAQEVGIGTSTLFALIKSESNWNPNATSTTGDYGLVQINPHYQKVTAAQALDPTFAIRFAAEAIKADRQWQWTSCSCVSYLRTFIPQTPIVNAEWFANFPPQHPKVGGAAVFKYGKSADSYHVAYITSFSGDGFNIKEANFKPCTLDSRHVAWNDPALVGFWSP